MRSGSNGQRDIHALAIGIRSTRIGRDILVVNIYRTLDEPVVGRHSIITAVLSTDIVTVVDNCLCAMYEVTRGLPFYGCSTIGKVLSRDGISIQSCQRGMLLLVVGTWPVFVLSIDETTTDTRLYVNQVELYNTGDVAPVFLIESQVGTLYFLRIQLQIHT